MSRLVPLAVAMLLGVVACSSQSAPDEPSPGPSPTVSVGSDGFQNVLIDSSDSYRFVPSNVYVDPGKIRMTVANNAMTTVHSLAFKPGGPPESIPLINPAETKSLELIINSPGDYPFFCTFHEQLGQSGSLHVGTAQSPTPS